VARGLGGAPAGLRVVRGLKINGESLFWRVAEILQTSAESPAAARCPASPRFCRRLQNLLRRRAATPVQDSADVCRICFVGSTG